MKKQGGKCKMLRFPFPEQAVVSIELISDEN